MTRDRITVTYRLLFDEWPLSDAEREAGGLVLRNMLRSGAAEAYFATSGGLIRMQRS